MPRKSTGKYPANWKKIAQAVKDEASWQCVRCEHVHDIENSFMLTVHHLDLNKSNCAWWNIPALCQRCHLSIQGKVIMERLYMFEHSEWFKPYVAGYYGAKNGLIYPTKNYYFSLILSPREKIINHMETFLSFGTVQSFGFE